MWRLKPILARLYAEGRGVPEDYTKARDLYRKAADKGDLASEINLALLLAKGGPGVAPDYAEAARLFGTAAARGNVTAQSNLAHLYAAGLGVTKDPAQAATWYQKSRRSGRSRRNARPSRTPMKRARASPRI